MSSFKFSVLGSTWSKHGDRWMLGGYHDTLPMEDIIKKAASVKGLEGIEFIYPFMMTDDNYKHVHKVVTEEGLTLCTIAAAISGFREHYRGALSSPDKMIRKNAIAIIKRAMDISHDLGVNKLNLWLGREGFDYPFQMDYQKATDFLVESLIEIGQHQAEVKVGIEYKIRDPKAHLFASTAARTVLLCQQTGCENMGVLMDTGHTLFAYENMGETICMLNHFDKLFHFHLNDNHRIQDDDMVVGSIHLFEFVEALFYLEKVGYQGWISFDPHPCGEDENRSVEESYRFASGVIRMIESIGFNKMDELLEGRRAMELYKLLQDYMFFR